MSKLSVLTNDQLKNVLRHMKSKDSSLSIVGNKRELVERINACVAYTSDEKIKIVKELTGIDTTENVDTNLCVIPASNAVRSSSRQVSKSSRSRPR